MNKQDLIKHLALNADVSRRDAEAVLDALATTIREGVADGNDILLPGVGKFSVTTRAARTARNPQTGAAIEVPSKRVPTFSAALAFKSAVAAK